MDINRKLQVVAQAIKSISTHDDADSVVLLAALGRVAKMVADESAAVRERQEAAAATALGEK